MIKRFGSAKGVALASDEDLKSVNGVTETVDMLEKMLQMINEEINSHGLSELIL